MMNNININSGNPYINPASEVFINQSIIQPGMSIYYLFDELDDREFVVSSILDEKIEFMIYIKNDYIEKKELPIDVFKQNFHWYFISKNNFAFVKS